MGIPHSAGAVLFTINLASMARFYERVMGGKVIASGDDHIRLEMDSFRLTVHQIPERYARNITIKTPPTVRTAGAVKLAFRVKSIEEARAAAAELGGAVYPPDREWQYEGVTICDGYDSDGNVFQLWQ